MLLELAGTKIALNFSKPAQQAIPFCRTYFRDFLVCGTNGQAEIRVLVLKEFPTEFLRSLAGGDAVQETRLANATVADLLLHNPDLTDSFQFSEKTLCAYCLGGLLLFDPESAGGRLLLPMVVGLRPLYRLLWLYFAQVLAESGACFLHAAALARDGHGYLFLGDSGAGKSTLAGIAGTDTVLSDDSPVFCNAGKTFSVFASPYHQLDLSPDGERQMASGSAEVKGFYFLVQDERAGLREISRQKAVLLLVNRHLHFFSYFSPRARTLLVDLFITACHNIPCYEFRFSRRTNVWNVIEG